MDSVTRVHAGELFSVSSTPLNPLPSAMNSQVTLVDSAALQPEQGLASTLLYFDVDNVHNATLSSPGGSASYIIESSPHATRTTVSRTTRSGLAPVVVGLIKRNNIIPDKITLEDGSSRHISEWLKTGQFSHRPSARAEMHVKGHKYIWTINPAGQLCMYAAEDETTPLAWVNRSRTQAVKGQTIVTPAVLALQKEVDNLRDEVVIAMTILEHKRRMSEKMTQVLISTSYSGQGCHPGGPVV
ncbi:hypothetical protein NM688_g8855 [Phlebia brevispora]|uniref:Uncharacterized protein n=1 Tax=Phlebia brevispora TaxID=194682 RepID=A0ACC1RP35_9APHY|nr:hypothetical protein NM688_g8855 [Phlebia brevispora]